MKHLPCVVQRRGRNGCGVAARVCGGACDLRERISGTATYNIMTSNGRERIRVLCAKNVYLVRAESVKPYIEK